jgi:SAM-dependent methyltransferase
MFYRIAEELKFQKPYSVLDIGCAGGGLVKSFIKDGHNAIGISETDTYRKQKAFEWDIIPESLFACDFTKPFEVFLVPPPVSLYAAANSKDWLREYERTDAYTARFDLIMMHGFEHTAKSDLPTVIQNIKNHLGGVFICPISSDVESTDWWDELLKLSGFNRREYKDGEDSLYLVARLQNGKVRND